MIADDTYQWDYVGSGTNDTFPYDRKIFDDSDLKVYVGGVLQTLNTHYAVTGRGENAGGNVVFEADYIPALDAAVVIIRDVPYTQEADWKENDFNPAQRFEDSIDRLTVQLNQTRRAIAEDETTTHHTFHEDSGADEISVAGLSGTLVDNQPSTWETLTNRPWYDTREYASINAAVEAIGSTPATLVVCQAETLTASLTIPSTLNLKILKDGSIVHAADYNLIINGPFDAGPYQVFSGFSAGEITGLKDIYPEWFGAKLDETTDDSDSLETMAGSVGNDCVVHWSGLGIFNTQLIFSADRVVFKGNGRGGLKLKDESGEVGQSVNHIWVLITGDDFKSDLMTYDGNGTNQVRLSNFMGVNDGTDTRGLRAKFPAGNIFKNPYGTALVLWGTAGPHIHGSTFLEASGDVGNPGEFIVIIDSYTVSIVGNMFDTSSDAAWYLTGSNSGINLTGNIVKNCSNAAANVYQTQDRLTIMGNDFDNCGANPISIDPAATVTNLKIIGNIDQGDKEDIIYFSDGDTDPNVSKGSIFYAANSNPTSITAFDGGWEGKIITVIFTNANTTITRSGSIQLDGGANHIGAVGKPITMVKQGTVWYQMYQAAANS